MTLFEVQTVHTGPEPHFLSPTAWDKYEAETPRDAALAHATSLIRGWGTRTQAALREQPLKMSVMVANPREPHHPNGSPMIAHGFSLVIGGNA